MPDGDPYQTLPAGMTLTTRSLERGRWEVVMSWPNVTHTIGGFWTKAGARRFQMRVAGIAPTTLLQRQELTRRAGEDRSRRANTIAQGNASR